MPDAETKSNGAPQQQRPTELEPLSEEQLSKNFEHLTPAQFESLLDIWQAKLFRDELNGLWKFNLLKEHRPQLFAKKAVESVTLSSGDGSRKPEVGGQSTEIKIAARVGSYKALAAEMDKFFKGRICKTIHPNDANQWCLGTLENLGWLMVDGVKTVPPACECKLDSGFYDPKMAIEWFSKWMLPQAKWRVKSDESQLTHEEKMNRFAERKAQREEDKANGEFKSVEIFNRHLATFGLAINRALNEAEKAMVKTILAELTATGDATEAIAEAIGTGVRSGIDALRSDMAKKILEAEECESHEQI